MKIGIIIGCLHYGGAERVASNLAKWLCAKGYDVSFYFTKKNNSEKEYSLPLGIKKFYCFRGNKISLIMNLHRNIVHDSPDVVIVMGRPMCVYAVPALLLTSIPYLVSERSAPGSARIKRSTRILSDRLMNFADAFVFQTEGAKKYFPKEIQERGCVIANPIILEDMPVNYKGTRTKRIVAVGRLIKEKNYPMLIAAFSEVHKSKPDYILDIYGDGPERDYLEKMIVNLNAQSHIRLNHSRDDVLEAVKSAEIYVLCSDLEGMPNALIEAMAIGLPCISTNCPAGGPADLIKNNIDGILIDVNDVCALQEKILELIENPQNAQRMGENAQKKICANLSIDVVGLQWEKVLLSIAKGRHGDEYKCE